jgi:hypothetical protein
MPLSSLISLGAAHVACAQLSDSARKKQVTGRCGICSTNSRSCYNSFGLMYKCAHEDCKMIAHLTCLAQVEFDFWVSPARLIFFCDNMHGDNSNDYLKFAKYWT